MRLFIVVNNNNFSVCLTMRLLDCILLVFCRRWGRLVMRDLINHDALLLLVGFQQLWLALFDPCCLLSDLLPWRSAVARLSCFRVLWSWASTLLEFLFHYPCWCCQSEVLHELNCLLDPARMQSKRRDLHHPWVQRETNGKLSFYF